ncbi:MAG: hypothetical protein CO141_00205 [Candidatus Moranbacteria bacterium CG_4_9_14_3_um_filter_42_9]|nr:MAG: hypothetical protein CO141_00205 [Candidatus Moranbacteria bacterium CG_4_9_14_3_um_filter_42_9]
MDVLIVASLITAFVAGMAALFAPCCISVLLPSYLGSIFREKYKAVAMTFLFFLGILTVFLPIGLGFSALAQFFKQYHNVIFLMGGGFLFVLGILILTKKTFSLPWSLHPTLKKHNAGSIYALGIFSGVATTCCAPVLAGVMALAVLPGSIFWGVIYTLMYVLGMVAPLFLIAMFLDKTEITKKMMNFRKSITLNLGIKTVSLTISELVSGLMFLVMGLVIIYYSFMNKLAVHADYQVTINIYFAKMQKAILSVITPIPSFIWAVLLAIFIFYSIRAIIKLINYFRNDEQK